MSNWAGKYVIGLTGNIGTGKSVVRRMLEHLGAYGIDADALAHRAIARGAPGYQPILDNFGRWLLDDYEQIDRIRLGRVVFNDPDALKLLENITHPLVAQAVDLIIRRSSQRVIVIEAIKLLESNLRTACDTIWVVAAAPNSQLVRLMHNRKMTEVDAKQRLAAQEPQLRKLAAAQVVIHNDGSFEETWKQVAITWKKQIPSIETAPTTPIAHTTLPQGKIQVQRAKPRQSAEIAALINRLRKENLVKEDIMAAFGEKAFLTLMVGTSLMGVIGWKVENLVARTIDIVIDPLIPMEQALPAMMQEMEQASNNLQCEVSLVFVPPDLARLAVIWKSLGYEVRMPQSLTVLAWQEAVQESMLPGTTLFFKQLRQDRILRPI